MATNVLQRNTIVFEATTTAVSSGNPIILGDNGLTGFALEDITNGSTGSVMLNGVTAIINFPVKGDNGSAGTAVAQYDKVYFTAGEAFFDVDNTATFFGYALEAVGSGDTTTVMVALVGAIT